MTIQCANRTLSKSCNRTFLRFQCFFNMNKEQLEYENSNGYP